MSQVYEQGIVTFSGLASGDRLLNGWNIDVVSGNLAIEPCQGIPVDVTLAASVCKGDSKALADQPLDLRNTVFDRFDHPAIGQGQSG
jgi:hypothetical protein